MAESAGKKKRLQDLCLPERYKCACVCERERGEKGERTTGVVFFNPMLSLRVPSFVAPRVAFESPRVQTCLFFGVNLSSQASSAESIA